MPIPKSRKLVGEKGSKEKAEASKPNSCVATFLPTFYRGSSPILRIVMGMMVMSILRMVMMVAMRLVMVRMVRREVLLLSIIQF